jgi:hypothetical protein
MSERSIIIGSLHYSLPGDAVAATTHRCSEPMLTGEANGSNYIGDAPGANNCGRLAVDHAIPYTASPIVLLIVSRQNRTVHQSTQSG